MSQNVCFARLIYIYWQIIVHFSCFGSDLCFLAENRVHFSDFCPYFATIVQINDFCPPSSVEPCQPTKSARISDASRANQRFLPIEQRGDYAILPHRAADVPNSLKCTVIWNDLADNEPKCLFCTINLHILANNRAFLLFWLRFMLFSGKPRAFQRFLPIFCNNRANQRFLPTEQHTAVSADEICSHIGCRPCKSTISAHGTAWSRAAVQSTFSLQIAAFFESAAIRPGASASSQTGSAEGRRSATAGVRAEYPGGRCGHSIFHRR
jgi:hypothetical protein